MARTSSEILASLPGRLIDVPRTWAEATPCEPVVFYEGQKITYEQLWQDIVRARDTLRNCGIDAGDRIGLVVENCYDALCFFYAITDLEATAVLANARLSEREIQVVFEEADVKGAIFTPLGLGSVNAHMQSFGGTSLGEYGFSNSAMSFVNKNACPEPVTNDPSKLLAAMLFTSGSTGVPKGAMLSHLTMLYQASMVSERREFKRGDCPYVVAPMVHILGLAGMVIPLIHGGAAMRLVSRFDPQALVEELCNGKLTHLYGAAPMFSAIASFIEKNNINIGGHKVKEILAGGAPAGEELRGRIAKIFGMPLGTGYAATECSPISASTPADPPNPGAVGKPWHGMEVRIAGKHGEDLATGEVGEVWCRGPNVMDGYYQNPEATAEVMRRDGWVAIGDLAYFDEDNQLHLVGRLKEMINRSGFNVYPAEIEQVLNSHPNVLYSAVVGRSVPGNEEVIAFVEASPGHKIIIKDLEKFIAGKLAPYKKPTEIILLEALPLGPTGKIAKSKLQDLAALK